MINYGRHVMTVLVIILLFSFAAGKAEVGRKTNERRDGKQMTKSSVFPPSVLLPQGKQKKRPSSYIAEFGDYSEVYDGDTWKNVYVQIKTLNTDYPQENVWPGIFLKGKTLYAMIDIRLAGIDTPEKRPKRKGRTEKSLRTEKAAARAAQAAAEKLLKENNYIFQVVNPQTGKFAGRIVATLLIGTEKINLANYLIQRGLGYVYTGGTKRHFDDWWEENAEKRLN